MMEHVSQFYQEEQTNIITRLKSLIEPIMIVALALLVGVILLISAGVKVKDNETNNTEITTKETIIEKEVPVEIIVEKEVPVEVEKIVEKEVIKEVEVPVEVEKIVEVEVEKIVEVPVEVVKEVAVEVPVEVEKIVEKEVIKEVEVPVEVEVEVEKIVEVEKVVEVIDYNEVERLAQEKAEQLAQQMAEEAIAEFYAKLPRLEVKVTDVETQTTEWILIDGILGKTVNLYELRDMVAALYPERTVNLVATKEKCDTTNITFTEGTQHIKTSVAWFTLN